MARRREETWSGSEPARTCPRTLGQSPFRPQHRTTTLMAWGPPSRRVGRGCAVNFLLPGPPDSLDPRGASLVPGTSRPEPSFLLSRRARVGSGVCGPRAPYLTGRGCPSVQEELWVSPPVGDPDTGPQTRASSSSHFFSHPGGQTPGQALSGFLLWPGEVGLPWGRLGQRLPLPPALSLLLRPSQLTRLTGVFLDSVRALGQRPRLRLPPSTTLTPPEAPGRPPSLVPTAPCLLSSVCLCPN